MIQKWIVLLVVMLVLPACLTIERNGEGQPGLSDIVGESLVLAQSKPSNLLFGQVIPESVEVRSTYEANRKDTVVYELGRDYVVDTEVGTITRSANSRIPDFSTNVLYGKNDFNHSLFPGYGNLPFFVFVDYESHDGKSLSELSDQSSTLKKTRTKLSAGGPFRLLVYGDSIAAGGEATRLPLRFPRRYAAYLASLFPESDIVVENGATGGDTTRQGLTRLEEKVLTRDPDLVLLAFGMNDNNVGSVPVEEFHQNLIRLIRQIRDRTDAEIILLSTFPPNPSWKFTSHKMADYAATTQQVAQEVSCAYADVYTLWNLVLERKEPESLLGNNINHPNDFGHWIYLQALNSIRF